MDTVNMNEQQVLDYIKDAKNYKSVRKKKVPFYCCVPPVGTVVPNRFNSERYRTTPENRFVIADYKGEHSIIDKGTFLSNFKFENGTDITTQWLDGEMRNDTIEWFKCMVYPPDLEYFACFIPESNTFCLQERPEPMIGNEQGRQHGKGDFVVCPAMDGKPVLQYARVVNGLDFSAMYNNRGWKDCIVPVKTDTIARPASLIKVQKKESVKQGTQNIELEFVNLLSIVCPKQFWDRSVIKALNSGDARFVAYMEESVRRWKKLGVKAETDAFAILTTWQHGIRETFECVAELLQPTYLRNVATAFRVFPTWKAGKHPWKAVCKWVADDRDCALQIDFSMELPYGIKNPQEKFVFSFSIFPSMERWKYEGTSIAEQMGTSNNSELRESHIGFGWDCATLLGTNIVPTLDDVVRAYQLVCGSSVHNQIALRATYYAGLLVTTMLKKFRLAIAKDTSTAPLLHPSDKVLKTVAEKEYFFMADDCKQSFTPHVYFMTYLQACLLGETMGTWNTYNGTLGYINDKGWVSLWAMPTRDKKAIQFAVEYSFTTDEQSTRIPIREIQIDDLYTRDSCYLRLLPHQVDCFLMKMYQAAAKGFKAMQNT